MEQKLRRYRTDLLSIGTGVISFGLWSCAKFALFLIISSDSIYQQLVGDEDYTPQEERLIVTIFIILLAVFLLADLLFRLYVGISARREAMGKKKGKVYLFFTAVMVAGTVFSLIMYISDVISNPVSISDSAVAIVVDTTAVVTQIELIVCVKRIRKLEKELAAGKTADEKQAVSRA